MGALSVEASGLRALLNRLVTYKVHSFHGSSSDPGNKADRDQADLDQADVVSSQVLNTDQHMVVLDIDHPCYLVKSSTPGHFHLYIDVPGGIEQDEYLTLLHHLGNAGIIEQGYANASIGRGASMVRLPWIKKEQPAPQPVPAGSTDPWAGLDHHPDEGPF